MRFEFMMGVADLRHPYSSARLTDARAQIIDALGLLLTPATKSIHMSFNLLVLLAHALLSILIVFFVTPV